MTQCTPTLFDFQPLGTAIHQGTSDDALDHRCQDRCAKAKKGPVALSVSGRNMNEAENR